MDDNVQITTELTRTSHEIFQGNFFANIGSILVFAVFGTVLSALIIGGGIYLLGKVSVCIFDIYKC